MAIHAYLFFEGRCDEAIAFYQQALGAEVTMLMRYGEAPVSEAERGPAADMPDKVMHAELTIAGNKVMLSDGRASGAPRFEGIALSLEVEDAARAERLFKDLADGGKVMMPMGPTFFAERFGMAADRFGVWWMITSRPHAAG